MLRRVSLAACLVAFTATAQDFRATIQGQVTDPSGASVSAATVKAIEVETNFSKEVKATADGIYTIPYLDPGTYTLEASAPGFQVLRRTQITLRVGDKLNVPFKLTVGQITQEVTVTGQQEVVETGSADRGLVFDPIKVQGLPLNGRQTYMLLALTPGVIFTQEQFGASGFSGTRGWDVNSNYKINGARTGQNLFLLNGAPISDQGGMWQLAPNVEAVDEFKVMTNTYDASYGRFGGGVVNTTLKSGTNDWHGNVFEYWRNRVLDANSFQNNISALPKGFHNQHQFGGVVGGPIRKDKDLVFFSFEGWQEVVPFPALQTVPPLDLRDGQHFTQYGYKIYDPLTRHPCNAATEACAGQSFISGPFPGNVIPPSRISPIGAKILSYFPAPNVNTLNNNFIASSNLGRYYYNQPMARWDHIAGPKDKIYALFTYQKGYEYRSTTGFPKPAATGNTDNERINTNYIADWNHVISPTTVLDVRASYGRFVQITPGYNNQAADLLAKDFGITNLTKAPTYPNASVPAFTFSGYGRLFAGDNSLSGRVDNQINFTPSLNMTRGRHNVRVGFELNYVARAETSSGAANGLFDFNNGWTQQRSGPQQNSFDGSTVASVLLGYPASGRVNYNDTSYRTRPYYGVYVQDDWKVNQRLTLNLGLRYDVQLPWLERFDRSNRGFDPYVKSPLSDQILAVWKKAKSDYDAANPNAKYPYPAPPSVITGGFLFPGKSGQPRRLYDTDWTNLAPRIGVAYRLRNDGKTVLRTGVGVFYQAPTQLDTTTGYQQQTNYITSLDGGITPAAGANLAGAYSLANAFPGGISLPLGAAGGLLTNVGNGGISFDPPHFKIPRTYQYSFGFEHELPGRILLESSYTGNYQIYVNLGYDMNAQGLAAQQQAIADPNYYSRTLPNPFFGLIPNNGNLGTSATTSAGTLLRPFPLFNGGITNNLLQNGMYRSDQLQVKVEKRVLGGENTGVMTWVLSYTWAKAFEANHRLNSWNTDEPIIYELDNTDKAHSLAFSGVWDLPLGQKRKFLRFDNKVLNGIVSDWRSSWIVTYVSGNPVGWPDLINSCSSWHAADQNENTWFNSDKSCYKQYPTNNIRTTPDRFGDLRAPAVGPFVNAAFEKTIPLTERYRVLLRAEGFNVTNSVQRPGPDTSFTSVTFGQLPKSQLNFPRFFQLAAKFYF